MIKKLLPIFILPLLFITVVLKAEISDDINNALKSGNASLISQYFGTAIDLSIPGNDGTYSKAQAEVILKDFFSKNAVKSYSVVHQGESKDGAKYAIGSLVTANGTFRTYCYLKKLGDKFFIKELRIENDK